MEQQQHREEEEKKINTGKPILVFKRVEHCNYPNSRQLGKKHVLKNFLFPPLRQIRQKEEREKPKGFWHSFHFSFLTHGVGCMYVYICIYIYNIHREKERKRLHEYLFRGHDDIG
jgi:hypothetical protein